MQISSETSSHALAPEDPLPPRRSKRNAQKLIALSSESRRPKSKERAAKRLPPRPKTAVVTPAVENDFWEGRDLPSHIVGVINSKAARELLKPKSYFAKELKWDVESFMTQMTKRIPSVLRAIFTANIVTGTTDEPKAPAIQVVNNVDNQPVPRAEFHYSNRIWHGDGVPPPDTDNLVGCSCEPYCDPNSTTCSCLKRQHEMTKDSGLRGFMYQDNGRLKKASYCSHAKYIL